MYFPITIIDNFLNNFNEIKNYAISQNFKIKNKNTITMPGQATDPLHILNNNYFKLSCNKILSLFFDRFIVNNHIQYNCESYFEKIISYGNQYNNQGWIHRDDENILSCIFYLQGDFNEGTSFFKKKIIGQHDCSLLYVKEALYKNEKIDHLFYNEKLKEHNSQFDLVLKVPLIENRIVIFDSSIFHCSDGYGNIQKPRLIQTSFFRSITGVVSFPVPELNRIN